jgi:hypothetical protein
MANLVVEPSVHRVEYRENRHTGHASIQHLANTAAAAAVHRRRRLWRNPFRAAKRPKWIAHSRRNRPVVEEHSGVKLYYHPHSHHRVVVVTVFAQ